MKTYYDTLSSPIGELIITSDGASIIGLWLPPRDGQAIDTSGWTHDPTMEVIADARRQLTAFFAGSAAEFNLPLKPAGTPFQQKVWSELLQIPYGETISYGELARRIGNPKASRAVGLANGQNPIAIVIPCHRVIGANGSLTGYGGGLPIKKALLDLERSSATHP